jgi:hypothetical protein
VNKIVGNGANTRFLIGNLPLKECFPRVFSIYTQKEASVADLWSGAGGVRWNFIWRRRLFVWEETLLEEIVGVLQEVNLTECGDRWSWMLESNGEFSVKSTYTLVFNLMVERGSLSQA